MKNRYAILLSILLGLAAVIGIKKHLDAQARRVSEEQRAVQILVAAQDLFDGHVLQEQDLVIGTIPFQFFHKSLLQPKDIETALRKKLRTPIPRGGLIRAVDIIEPEAREAVFSPIPTGKRLFAVQVDLTTGVGGHLKPGSWVDCLAVLRETEPGGAGKLSAAEERVVTVLERLKVFAVGPQGYSRTGYTLESATYSAVTLIVTPREAELLAFVQAQGKLILVERSEVDAQTGVLSTEGVRSNVLEEIVRQLRVK